MYCGLFRKKMSPVVETHTQFYLANNEKKQKNFLFKSVAEHLYHRERIWFSSTLSCIKEEEEITKPPAYQVINRCLSPLP
jgi:hypothetical protein